MAWITKILNNQKIPVKNKWIIALLAGLLILIIAMPVSDKGEQSNTNETGQQTGQMEDDYAGQAETRLKKVLEEMEGVGKVDVMVTLSASSEKIIEKDRETQKEEDRTTTREETVYDDSFGQGQSPYVTKELSPSVEGVVVIAEGGDRPVVVQNITEAVQALFDVESHKIKVVKRK